MDGSNSSHQWIAGNIEEFYRALSSCGEGVMRDHAGHLDFSRWIRDVIQDVLLAERMRELERAVSQVSSPLEVYAIRDRMLKALEDRYFD